MKLSRTLAALFVASAANAGAAEDWRYSIGVHDLSVPDVSSNTYGVNGSVSMDMRTDGGQHYFGSLEMFLDHDKDHLDSDHIPLWWQLHLGSDGDFWRAGQMRVGWTANVDTRMNTVSSVERQITALPALVGGYDGQNFQASLEAGAGWFFLEIDDDAPREQGYDRSTLRHSTFAYAATQAQAQARRSLVSLRPCPGLVGQPWGARKQLPGSAANGCRQLDGRCLDETACAGAQRRRVPVQPGPLQPPQRTAGPALEQRPDDQVGVRDQVVKYWACSGTNSSKRLP